MPANEALPALPAALRAWLSAKNKLALPLFRATEVALAVDAAALFGALPTNNV